MKHEIKNAVSDLVTDLLFYDRKEDEDLPMGAIEEAIKTGEITTAEIVNHFRFELNRGLQ